MYVIDYDPVCQSVGGVEMRFDWEVLDGAESDVNRIPKKREEDYCGDKKLGMQLIF